MLWLLSQHRQKKCPYWATRTQHSRALALRITPRFTLMTETTSRRSDRPGGAFTSRLKAISWRRTTPGEAPLSAVQDTVEWIPRETISLHVSIVWAILTSSSSLAEQTMPGQTRPWANISIRTGLRRTAKVSVPHLPSCSTCFRNAIQRPQSTPC